MDTSGQQQSKPARVGVRASDMDRERVATLLQSNYSEGRLTLEEFQERLDKAYAAKTMGDLGALTADLPVQAQPQRRSRADQWKRRRDQVLTYVVIMAFLVAIWAISGREGSFWPIWPIVVGGFILALTLLGGERSAQRQARRTARRARRQGGQGGPGRQGGRGG